MKGGDIVDIGASLKIYKGQEDFARIKDNNLYIVEAFECKPNRIILPFQVVNNERKLYVNNLNLDVNNKAYIWGFQIRECFK